MDDERVYRALIDEGDVRVVMKYYAANPMLMIVAFAPTCPLVR
jgi:hypothetical protein